LCSVRGGSALNSASPGIRIRALKVFSRYLNRCILRGARFKVKFEIDEQNLSSQLHLWKDNSRTLLSAPLPSRGWALQERLLPSQILHFISTQVFWEFTQIFRQYHQQLASKSYPEQFAASIPTKSLLSKVTCFRTDVELDSTGLRPSAHATQGQFIGDGPDIYATILRTFMISTCSFKPFGHADCNEKLQKRCLEMRLPSWCPYYGTSSKNNTSHRSYINLGWVLD
jgi:hypothetical protein